MYIHEPMYSTLNIFSDNGDMVSGSKTMNCAPEPHWRANPQGTAAGFMPLSRHQRLRH